MNWFKIRSYISLFFLLVLPVFGGGRYTDCGDGTVIDTCTGLMWLKDAGAAGTMGWEAATNYCANLVTNGYSDWRLPSVNRRDGIGGSISAGELDTLFRAGGLPSGTFDTGSHLPFTNLTADYYWSSIHRADESYPFDVWIVEMVQGQVSSDRWDAGTHPVWPVRGTSSIVSKYFLWVKP